jgi:hypothetical protein
MMRETRTDTARGLRAWACGTYNTEAAAEVLIRAFGGRFADLGWPWIVADGHQAWLDASHINDDTIGALSGGEKRVLRLVSALLEPRTVDLGDIASGIDRASLGLVLAAVAHAGGSHQHTELQVGEDGRPVGFAELGSLYAWPE